MSKLRKQIFGSDPYKDFDDSLGEVDLQGWGSEHPVFKAVISRLRPELIIEVGTWKGASAIHMANLCTERGLKTEIVCVDTWLGAASTLTHGVSETQADRFASLKMQNGFPMLYFTFLRNVVECNVQDKITPIAQTSENAAKILRFYDAQADIIYVDAAHEADPVYRDLLSYWSLLKPGGVLIGDDRKHRGVARGLEMFVKKTGRELVDCGRKYLFFKPVNSRGIFNSKQDAIRNFADEYAAKAAIASRDS